MFKLRFFHEHQHHSDPEIKREIHDIRLMLDTIMHRLSNLAHGQARIEAEVVDMKDEMTAEIAKIEAREAEVAR